MKAVLVAIHLPGVTEQDFKASLAELKRLATTLGYEVIGNLTQKRRAPSPATAIGEGKLQELAAWTGGSGEVAGFEQKRPKGAPVKEPEEDLDEPEEEEIPSFPVPTGKADKVVFDQELTPNQLSNLQQATDAEILDRTGLIIEIFHRHAKTQEARIQVEIARLKYLAPRIQVSGAGERQGGGIGAKGIGETSHEIGKRRIRDRIAELQQSLERLNLGHSNRRERRKDLSRIALVGYTNAGKSSLMRALTGSTVLVENKLFATLDTTVRQMQPDIFPRVLISDTVGFIQKLPHDLVASFRSTLEEAREATLLLYVVDASDPTFHQQLEVTRSVLSEVDCSDIESLLILNKSDLLSPDQIHQLKSAFPEAHVISTLNPQHVKDLKTTIRDFVGRNMEEAEILVRYDDKTSLLGKIRNCSTVLSETYEEEGVRLKIRTHPETLNKLKSS